MAAQVQLSRKRVAPLLSFVGGKARSPPQSSEPQARQSSPNPEDSPISVVSDDEFGVSIPATIFKGLPKDLGAKFTRNVKTKERQGEEAKKNVRPIRNSRNSNTKSMDADFQYVHGQSRTPESTKKRKRALNPVLPVDEDSDTDMFGSLRSSQIPLRKTYSQRRYEHDTYAPPKKVFGAGASKPIQEFHQNKPRPLDPSRPSLPAFKPPPTVLEVNSNQLSNFHAPRRRRSFERQSASLRSFIPPVATPSSPDSAISFKSLREPASPDLLGIHQPNTSSPKSSSTLSSPRRSIDDLLDWQSHETNGRSKPTPKTVPCPLCKMAVTRTAWEAFTQANGSRLKIRQQRQFCHGHQKESALERWKLHHYPTIEWGRLPERLTNYNDLLLGIIDGRISSHFRDELDKRVSTGRNRNDLRNPLATEGSETHSPGYYGLRGAKLMLEHVTEVWGDHIRMQSTPDPLIAKTSLSGYLQAVLVPELGTCLIMQDMSVGPEKAREILRSSADDGDLVHGEEDEDEEYEEEEDEQEEDEDGEANQLEEVRAHDDNDQEDEAIFDIEAIGNS